ncbi:phytanoyl-CoA dioxygenase family protein [Oceanomicrobium pacificus]|uniref:Phytanoyl-CoA dioxygenase family protein n=1 Tax=Oceanomicrobium pacificus TaxID=2692916 RepID=A0A6B0TTE4_9RHOB|nr:phytanoyl-CoA dioxygenase family protein [Oceanomicrobium pacificus]MXU65075.1 phytanoyl-CoA dioxygenase family protein [Oceanomicrobium pacificus]
MSSTTQSLTAPELADYERDGYVIRKGLLSAEEVTALNAVVNNDKSIADAVYGRTDASGATTELALWQDLGDDMFGALARSRRIVDSMNAMLGGEAAFFHSKLTLKRPKVGGAWDWHQDYGYWYRSGFLMPDMASVFIALDPCRKENGCLQVLKGSHKLGRIEHGINKEQVGADMGRVEAAMKRMELVYAEMDPGDALFFHGNTLHSSSANTSDRTRNVLLCCYSRADNPSILDKPNTKITPIDPLDDDRVMDWLDKPIDAQRPFAKASPAA